MRGFGRSRGERPALPGINEIDAQCPGCGGGAVSASLAAYEALGNASISYTSNQNATIDKTAYWYFTTVIDESGGGAIPGNRYTGLAVTFTCADARPA